MKKIFLIFSTSLLAITAIADEGMWLPSLLKNNYAQMQQQGLKLTAEQLYDVNHASLKDAIVWFNGGCTAEIVSEQGLLLTNHHCGYESITKHSTTSDNILDNGFWAKSLAEEKENPGLWAAILVRMEDVSERVNKAIAGVSAADMDVKKSEIFKTIEAEAKKGNHYDASVKSLFKDNAYYLYVFEKFTDVRLVGTPPQSIGKFGGDTDNWIWPRHTGDFSMFRIYANKNNEPAAYSKDNVPYKPKHFLSISTKGVKENDYTMVYGFPGRTNRYETSYGIKLAIEKVNPAIVALRDVRLTEWKIEMNKSDSVRLLLSSQYAKVSNYWKYYIGQTEQLKHLKVFDEKKNLENQFAQWAITKPEYASILPNFEKAYASYNAYALHSTYIREGIMGCAILSNAMKYISLSKALEKQDQEKIQKAVEYLRAENEEFYKHFNVKAEEHILARITSMYYQNIAKDQQPEYMNALVKKYGGKTTEQTFENFAKAVFAKSIMADKERATKYLSNPELKKLEKDLAFQFAYAIYQNYNTNILPKIEDFDNVNSAEGKKYIKALMEMQPNKNFYPDANSTIRLTYGSIKAYSPHDAVEYNYFTTLDGIMEKENPNDFEFTVPAKLKELYNKKDFGNYADSDGKVHVAFISNNDITGGNSGSPVINGNGELVGLAFDGNWEAMSGDIYFDSKYKRTISCDIRYVLFLIDKLGGATNLINELRIVSN